MQEIIETNIADNVTFARFPTLATLYALDKMAKTTFAVGVTFYLTSTMNQAVTIQAVGHAREAPTDINGLINVGAPVSLPALGRIGLSVDLTQNRYSYFGLTVLTGATAPTAGQLDVLAQVEPRLEVASDPAVAKVLADMALLLSGVSQSQAAVHQAAQELLGRPIPATGLIGAIFGQPDRS